MNLSLSFFPEERVLDFAAGDKNLYYAVKKQEDLTDYVIASPYTNLDVIPSSVLMSGIEYELFAKGQREFILKNCLAGIRVSCEYDYILIDCPPALSLITCNALVASDYMVMVTNAEGLSYRGMKMVANLNNEVAGNKRLNPHLQIKGVIVTRFENNNLSNFYLEKLQNELGSMLILPVVRKSTKIAQSASFQQSIFKIDPQGRTTQEYIKVAHELLQRVEIQ